MISEVDAPASSASKIVVNGFISPGTDQITVVVSMTRGIYVPRPADEGQLEIVKDATVLISDGSDTVQLIYNPQFETYRISQDIMPVKEGVTYYLKVTAPGGYEATSSCTVPNKLPPDLEIESIDSSGSQHNQSYILYFKFRDLEGEGDYYSVSAGRYYKYTYFPGFESDSGIYNESFDRGEPFISDKNVDGQYFSYKTYDLYFDKDEESKIYLAICITDEDYYKYHKALYNRDEENPFAEPYPLYSNINGGLGIFSAFTSKIIELEL